MEGLKGEAASAIFKDIMNVYVYDAADKVRKSAFDAINSFASSEEAASLLTAVEILTKTAGVNVKDARRRIADKLIEDNCYKF